MNARLLVTLALLSAAAPFATDLYLPAFPSMVADFSTTASGVQLSLTSFLIGVGVGQLVFGPLSDRFGRRRPLLLGTALYVLASAATAIAPTLPLLVIARLVQGFSGAAGMVIARAVVSDLAHGREAARAFSLMMLVGGVAPVVAPVAGSLLSSIIGWRGLLWIVAALGAAALLASALFLRETHPASTRTTISGSPLTAASALLNRRFIGNALAFSFAFGTLIAYISASPFLFQDLMGMTQLQYGLVFGLNALVLAGTGGLSARLVRRYRTTPLAWIGLLSNLGGILAIAALAVLGAPPLWLTAPILVSVAALGFVLGNTTALALDQLRQAAGLGSAVLGLLQFSIAGAVAPLVGVGGTATAIPLAATMLTASVMANLCFLAAGHRRMAPSLATSAVPHRPPEASLH